MLFQSLLTISNFIILLASIGLAAVGIYGVAINAPFAEFFYSASSGVVLALGVLLAIFSLIGLYAARVKSRGLMRVFFFLVTLTVVGLIVVGTLALARSIQAENIVWDSWKHAKNHDPEALKQTEQTFHCCGLADVNDDAVPGNCAEDPAFGFKEPCKPKIQPRIEALLEHVGRGTMFFTLIVVVAMVFGMLFLAGANEERGISAGMRPSSARMAGFVREGEVSPSRGTVR
jgi:hypothetical protein